jgi:hypothetical protein
MARNTHAVLPIGRIYGNGLYVHERHKSAAIPELKLTKGEALQFRDQLAMLKALRVGDRITVDYNDFPRYMHLIHLLHKHRAFGEDTVRAYYILNNRDAEDPTDRVPMKLFNGNIKRIVRKGTIRTTSITRTA